MRFPRGLHALEHRPFRRFFLAQLLSQVGTWMQSVSQAWLVLQLTGSPLKLGLLGTLQFGPILVLSVVAGVIADRWSRRRLLIATQATLAAQAAALAALVATGRARYWQVAVLALLTGLATAVDAPARQSFVMSLVGRADILNAAALNSAAFNAARIVGPALAGVLIARFGVVPAFAINAVGLGVVLLTLLALPPEAGGRAAAGGSVGAQIGETVRFARRSPEIVPLLGLLLVVSLCVFNFSVYVPLLARTVLGVGPEGFGFLMAALGIGAVSGALALGARATPDPGLGLLLAAAAGACAGLVLLSASGRVGTVALLLLLTGASGIVATTGCNTALQLLAPDELRGRVMSLYTWVYGGAYPVGSFLVGAISERYGVAVALRGMGVIGLLLLAALAAGRPERTPARAVVHR